MFQADGWLQIASFKGTALSKMRYQNITESLGKNTDSVDRFSFSIYHKAFAIYKIQCLFPVC